MTSRCALLVNPVAYADSKGLAPLPLAVEVLPSVLTVCVSAAVPR